MLKGIYSPEAPTIHLRNVKALLRENPENPDNYLAQFDPVWLKEAFGWWSFPKKDFINVVDISKVLDEEEL